MYSNLSFIMIRASNHSSNVQQEDISFLLPDLYFSPNRLRSGGLIGFDSTSTVLQSTLVASNMNLIPRFLFRSDISLPYVDSCIVNEECSSNFNQVIS